MNYYQFDTQNDKSMHYIQNIDNCITLNNNLYSVKQFYDIESQHNIEYDGEIIDIHTVKQILSDKLQITESQVNLYELHTYSDSFKNVYGLQFKDIKYWCVNCG